MPHAEDSTIVSTEASNMSEVLTNGETLSSDFINHLTSYPVVSDSIGLYKENPLGAKSISLASNAYQRFFTPIKPYLETPYSYAQPYLAKADSLGDAGLEKIDSKFPVVKEDTAILKGKVQDAALYPLALGTQGKDYFFETYSQQRKGTAVNQGGILSKLLAEAKAMFLTEYKIGSDAFNLLASLLSFAQTKGDEAKKFAGDKLNN